MSASEPQVCSCITSNFPVPAELWAKVYTKFIGFVLNILEPMLIKSPTPDFINFPLSQEQESFTISPEMVDKQVCCVFIFILKNAEWQKCPIWSVHRAHSMRPVFGRVLHSQGEACMLDGWRTPGISRHTGWAQVSSYHWGLNDP